MADRLDTYAPLAPFGGFGYAYSFAYAWRFS
jgi:hypothetical protein